MRKLLVAATVALAALATSACGTVEPYAATVNGTRIESDSLNDELEAMRANKAYMASLQQNGGKVFGTGEETFDSAFVARVLTRQIFYELIDDELDERNSKVTQADLDAARADLERQQDPAAFAGFPGGYRDTLVRRAAGLDKITAALGNGGSSPAAIQAYYDQNRTQLAQSCVSHILVRERGQADSIRARLSGGADFAAIARAESLDAGSGQQGGDLGCLDPANAAQLVAEFRNAVNAATVGAVTNPVQTQFGWHLILVRSRQQLTLEQATPLIQQLLQSNGDQALNTFLTGAVEEADVDVNPRYGRFVKQSADGQAPSVVPPTPPSSGLPPPAATLQP